MLNMRKFGEFVSRKRLENNMTQLQIANQLYVTPQAVSKWERGESFPDIETLVLLCYELNIHIDFLLSECFESITFNKEITLENIEDCLHSPHRKAIIDKIIQNELQPITILSIFYMLNRSERYTIIDKILTNEIEVNCAELIILLNPSERKRFLTGLKNTNFDAFSFIHLLNPTEKSIYINN